VSVKNNRYAKELMTIVSVFIARVAGGRSTTAPGRPAGLT
jgi:hypothetical protein